MDSLAKYMSKIWRKRTPDIIVSVISSISHFKTWEDLAQVEDFQSGLTQVMSTSWVSMVTYICMIRGNSVYDFSLSNSQLNLHVIALIRA